MNRRQKMTQNTPYKTVIFRLATTSQEDFECKATENLQIPNDFFPEGG